MARYILIGGRSTNYLNDFSLENMAFEKLKIKNPKILFIPAAAYKNIEGAISKFKALTERERYDIKFLDDYNQAEFLFEWADVIYFGGGDCEKLVEIVNNSILIELLNKYQNSNKVYAGLSAGAMLYTKYGMGDGHIYTYNGHIYNYQMVKCLGFLNITICPHYDHDGLWCYNDEVKNYDFDGYALEDDTAIIIENEKVEVIKREKSKSVYYFSKNNNYKLKAIY